MFFVKIFLNNKSVFGNTSGFSYLCIKLIRAGSRPNVLPGLCLHAGACRQSHFYTRLT